LKPFGVDFTADFSGVKTGKILALKGLLEGILSGRLILNEGNGNFTFRLREISGLPVGFSNASGIAEISGGALHLKSVSLEGEGVYGKLKGTIRGGAYELTAEVMPEPGSPAGAALAEYYSRYEASPGYYVIPLSGRLRTRS
jgi:hypothetical protein